MTIAPSRELSASLAMFRLHSVGAVAVITVWALGRGFGAGRLGTARGDDTVRRVRVWHRDGPGWGT